MAYGIKECGNCGGEVKVYEGHGGTCPHCGHWVSVGNNDSISEEIARKEEQYDIEEKIWEKMLELAKDAEARGTLRIVTYYREYDDDRYYTYKNEFTDLDKAMSSQWDSMYFFDGDKKITVD